jgi:hypothetical protein
MKVQYPVDRAMFYNSTYILIGNSRNTPFWEARWLNEQPPRTLPLGYTIQQDSKIDVFTLNWRTTDGL